MPRTLRFGLVVAAAVVSIIGCADNPPPPPSPSPPPVALGPVEVTAVGDVVQGGGSVNQLVLVFSEAGPTGMAAGPGSFQVTVTDHAGLPDTLRFTGTPSATGPGSLGVSATLSAPNVVTISIADSDSVNLEPITVTGLGIEASPSAALGSMQAVVSGCSGSLEGCIATNALASPGTVVAAR